MDHPRAIGLLACYFMNSLPFARPGVIAGKEAGMKVVAVPSLPKQSQLFTSADEVINSLLDFQPDKWGLPAFDDCESAGFFPGGIIHVHFVLTLSLVQGLKVLYQ